MIREHNPGIICLQETKLGNVQYNPGLNYSVYNSPPPVGDRAKGGAAIIAHKSLQHSLLQLNTNLQAVAVTFTLKRQITVCSVYLPPDLVFSYNDIHSLLNQLPTPFLLLGDFNAHNPLWGGDIIDAKGRILEDIVDNHNITLLNNGAMTYHNIYTNSYSAIDLSICSSSVHLDYVWSVNEYLNGSDHFPIHIRLVESKPSESSPKWKVDEADWKKFSNSAYIERNVNSFPSITEAYTFFTEVTLESATASIPKTKGKPSRPAVPWWNKTCSNMRKITRKTYKKYKKTGSTQAKITYQRAKAKQNKCFKKAKRESWVHYINGISSKTPSKMIWKKIKKLSGKFVPDPLPTLKINCDLITQSEEVAEKLGEHFSRISSSKNYSRKFQDIRNAQVSLDLSENNYEPYNAKFTLRELKDALENTEPSAPGEDTILYEMLKHLPERSKEFLLDIINKIWETGIIPKIWKTALIIPMKKPNKDPSLPSSYRPIALTSCVCKLMEKMINTRLVWHLETNNLLSPFQFGFRKNRSTLDPLLRLSNQIQQGFSRQCQTIGVFFDLEKAYDTTWRFGIIKELLKLGIKGKMVRFINSFLSERFIKVRVGNHVSQAFPQEEGVPQGSVLSVTLFAVAINKILENVTPPVRGSLFVDDLALYCTGYDAVSICRFMQRAIDSVSKWANEHGFKFSESKTVAVRFCRRRTKETIPTLTLNGTILPFSTEVKFLGMVFDEKLTWNSHIDQLKMKAKGSLNILKVVSGFNWGADKNTLLRLYNAMCRSKLDYGCQVYSSASKTKLKELDVVHNMGLRICTGAFRTSPVESLYVDSHQMPLDLRRQELGLRYTMRLKSSRENPTYEILAQCDSSRFRKKSSVPFQIRQLDELEDENIQTQKILQVKYPAIPPWFIPEVNVCTNTLQKRDRPVEEVKSKFLAHDNCKHGKDKKIYTDGSKSRDGVGCAVVCEGESYIKKLPDSSSVFSAEATAVIEALQLANKKKFKSSVIYSDSRSVLEALKKYNPLHPLIQKAQEWLFHLSVRRKVVKFCWIPGHIGLEGNELADREAKDAASSGALIKKVPHLDMRPVIKSYIHEKWRQRWSSPFLLNNRKYRRIRDDVGYWSSGFNANRRYEVILTRLRIGHTRMTHNYIMEGSSAPVCAHCGTSLSIEHVLVCCPHFNHLRRKYFLAEKSISEILGDNTDVNNLMGFAKEAKIFNDI